MAARAEQEVVARELAAQAKAGRVGQGAAELEVVEQAEPGAVARVELEVVELEVVGPELVEQELAAQG
jgi:hypothetical protein